MLLNIPLFFIVKFISKNEKLSVIGSSQGKYFADNSKYFYIYFHKIKKDKINSLVWITKNKDVVYLLKSQNLPVEYLYSLKGIYTTIKASKVFLSHQLDDIYGPLFGGSEIIQLWHGFPLKKIGYRGDWFSETILEKIKYFLYKSMPFNYYMNCDKLIAPSPLAKESFKEAFSLSFNKKSKYENILTLGQSRNDSFEKNYIFDILLFPEIKKLEQYKNDFKYVISWLPTQRKALDKTILQLIEESKLDLLKLDSFCQKNNILFVFKPHFLDMNILSDKIQKYKNLIIYEIADPYPLLSYTDILLTDYSSVCFDFLLTQKPIIFAPFDYEAYLSRVNFYQNYDEMTAGIKCYTWSEILENITLIINHKDNYINQRKLFLEKLGFKKNSSELIYNTFFKDN